MEQAVDRRFSRGERAAATRAAHNKTMSRAAPTAGSDRRAWLLAIGRRLRIEYDALQDPVPGRLGTLIKRLDEPEVAATHKDSEISAHNHGA
jgi:hypothetical protein